MSAPVTSVPPPSPPTWEFTPAQDAILARLASRMRFVGIALIGLAALLAGWSMFGTAQGDMIAMQAAIVLGLTGVWSARGAAAFGRVARTRGADMLHLMRALGEIARLYELQYWVFLAAALLLAVTVLVAATGAALLRQAW